MNKNLTFEKQELMREITVESAYEIYGESLDSRKELYQTLKQELLSGKKTPEQVKLILVSGLDQKSLKREAAFDNVAFLEDSEVKNFFEHQDNETFKTYKRVLSGEYWHSGQIEALHNQDTKKAAQYFLKARQLFSECGFRDEKDSGYLTYIEATCLYLQNKEIPQNLLERVYKYSPDRNGKIVERMIDSQKQGLEVNYERDYCGN
jgi:hypothetical protein